LKTTPAVFINGYGNQITEHQPFAYRRSGEVIRVNGRYNNVSNKAKKNEQYNKHKKITAQQKSLTGRFGFSNTMKKKNNYGFK
jgi:hypothetical protein